MPTLLLTDNNIDFSKQALRGQLEHIKSSHRAEALAAATGFGTYAALLAELKRNNTAFPKVAQVDANAFAKRLGKFGYEEEAGEFLIEIARSPDLPDPTWREFPNRDLAANNSWFSICQNHGIPNVSIKRRRKYVKLNWDCISVDHDNEFHLHDDKGAELVRKMFQRYQALVLQDPGRSEFFGSAFAGDIDNLLPEVAYDLADEIFMFLYIPMQTRAAT